MAEEPKLGFDGLVDDGDEGQKSYTVQFTPTEEPTAEKQESVSEEITLIERSQTPPQGEKKAMSPEEEERKIKEQSVYFDDGVRRIDFVLTYQLQVDKKKKQDTQDKQDKRKAKREKFLESCREAGLEFEEQDASESPDRKTYFLKVHCTHQGLLKGADEILLRMPIKENTLEVSTYRERFFDFLHIKDPFEPNVPPHLEVDNYFTAPFKLEKKENYIGWDDEKNFFTTAQRSMIVWHLLQNARYGKEEDQLGIPRLLANSTFSDAFPMHDSSYKLKDTDPTQMTDRQFLFARWSHPRNWYKRQPLDQIRRYFGEKVGIYFAWLGFYTSWLLPASIVGIIVMIYGLSQVNFPVVRDICNDEFRYSFYMCPRCDRRCDFWYITDSCNFARLTAIFDNGGTVFFAIFMAFWAVLFLEFWKRAQYYIDYDWDMLGYEEAEQRARPEFEQRIKRYIRHCNTDTAKEKFFVYNPVLEKREYIQPQYWLLPKVIIAVVVLLSMSTVAILVVFLVLLYRLAVAGLIYSAVNGLPLGPSLGDLIVAITGAIIQLIFILILNKVSGFIAYKLTNWELQRTQTEYEDSFTIKMYFFQFVNFYASLFYIAFFKGNLTGNPGGYSRISVLRIDECATYGCLFELTIQLGIIMVGKQLLNNAQELAIPYVKRIVSCLKHKEETEEDIYTRWEKDFDLVKLDRHGLFSEYLELVIQYGFITIFVAAFPLAPLFALLNNWVEIRLDAHKFTAVLRRPVAERAQDIGAWFYLLTVVSQFAVVTNALLIAITSGFVPQAVYLYGGYQDEFQESDARLSGFLDWSLTNFTIDKLVDGQAFPAFTAHELQIYLKEGDEKFEIGNEDVLYLPFINLSCLADQQMRMGKNLFNLTDLVNTTAGELQGITEPQYEAFYKDQDLRNVVLVTDSPSGTPVNRSSIGPCFNPNVQCRFRGYAEDGGYDENNESVTVFGVRYWQLQAARLAFIVVFEHFIFVIAAFLAFIVPDVPQSVKNEIQREKLLAYDAVHAVLVQSGDEGEGDTPISAI